MNVASFTKSRFALDASHLRTDRDNEYLVLSRVTRKIQQSYQSGSRADLIEGISANIKLWTVLSSDLAQPGNALPDTLKASLLSLALFSIKHSHRVLSEDASPDPLLEINLRIMKGLRGEVAA